MGSNHLRKRVYRIHFQAQAVGFREGNGTSGTQTRKPDEAMNNKTNVSLKKLIAKTPESGFFGKMIICPLPDAPCRLYLPTFTINLSQV